MPKPVFEKRVESWNVQNDGSDARVTTPRIVKAKIAVRVAKGQPGGGRFHGATNFKQGS